MLVLDLKECLVECATLCIKSEVILANRNKGCRTDPNKILKIRKDKNCTNDCIPTIFSSLFDLSKFKECPDYDSHFCALEEIFGYVHGQPLRCTNSGVEKYFDGFPEIYKGISYAHWASRINISTMGNDDERSQTLLAFEWIFVSPYVNPIPTGLGHVTLIYGLIPPIAGRNRVKQL